MAKSQIKGKAFIPVFKNKNKYMLFKEDIRKIYKIKKIVTPPVPKFDISEAATEVED